MGKNLRWVDYLASNSAKCGAKSYTELRALIKGTGLEAHHLIEQRFAKALGVDAGKMVSIALTKAEHIKFTIAWRLEIGYNNSKKLITTASAGAAQINAAAKIVYKDHPEILRILGL